MTWDVWGKVINTTEAANAAVFQPFKFQRNTILRAVKVKLLLINDPTFTAVTAKIFGNNENTANPEPSTLLYSATNTKAKGDLLTQNSAIAETYFEFDDPMLRFGTYYHLVLNLTGYTAASDSYVAWKHAFPDPFNSTDDNIEDVSQYPLECLFWTAAA